MGGPNRAPDCGITAPEDGSSVAVGAELRFEGFATDPDVSADQLTATWSSDVDGELRTGAPDPDGTLAFATSSLTTARWPLMAAVMRGVKPSWSALSLSAPASLAPPPGGRPQLQ